MPDKHDVGLSSIFWWVSLGSLLAALGAVLSLTSPRWINLLSGGSATLQGAEWLVACAHTAAAIFLGTLAVLEWRTAHPRRMTMRNTSGPTIQPEG